jgi:6-phosphofructokinase
LLLYYLFYWFFRAGLYEEAYTILDSHKVANIYGEGGTILGTFRRHAPVPLGSLEATGALTAHTAHNTQARPTSVTTVSR